MMKHFTGILVGVFFVLFLISPSHAGNHDSSRASYLKLPLSFVKNEGQKGGAVLFHAQGAGHGTLFTREGVSLSLNKTGKAGPSRREIITLTPLGGSPCTVEALDPGKGRVNYFTGRDPSGWKTNIPTYGAILYRNIYPGIDMKFYGTNSQLEYDIIVSPRADPSKVRLSYEGIEGLSVSPEGELEITLKQGAVFQKKPVAYQTVNGKRTEVEGRFVLLGKSTYGFEVGAYDREAELVIDPLLKYSTYLGGTGNEQGLGIAVDSSANVYVTGCTGSADFTTTANAAQPSFKGSYDAFVTRFDASGAVVYSTYLGGEDDDCAHAIAVDGSGNVYVAGHTASDGFPTTANAYQTAYAGGSYDAFVTKLGSSGALVYSTYLGGNDDDQARAVALDSSGRMHVAGYTCSADFTATANACQAELGGVCDAFVSILDPSKTGAAALAYSTYLGGSEDDNAAALAVDSHGNSYVAGYTASSDFATTITASQRSYGGSQDAFVAKIGSSGSLLYSTYLGGSDYDYATSIALDTSGNAHVGGYTGSEDFPVTTNALQGSFGGNYDGFLTRVGSSGTFSYSTYLGGSDYDYAMAVAVDSSGYVHIAGYTGSEDFTVTANAFQGLLAGLYDGFITKLSLASEGSSALLYSTYFGGSDYDYIRAVAVDSSGVLHVAGFTSSADFTTTVDAYQQEIGGGYDAFLSIFNPMLNVTVKGSGSVLSTPEGIDCGSICSATFDAGTHITLTATAAAGYAFAYWSGLCNNAAPACIFTTNGDMAVTALFASETSKKYKLTVTKMGKNKGTGTIMSDDLKIDCGETCKNPYFKGTPVFLTAVPDAGVTFTGWSGACTGTGVCRVTMNSAKKVTANFKGPLKLTVQKQKVNGGNGTVTSDPAGISCGPDCAGTRAFYLLHEAVTLTAQADADSVFVGWSLPKCQGRGTCTVTMDSAKTVTAKFKGPQTLTVKKVSVNGGTGSVTSDPAGIVCGDDCTGTFRYESQAVLTAAPDTDSTLLGWFPAGVCTTTTPDTCTVTMTAAKTVKAKFTK